MDFDMGIVSPFSLSSLGSNCSLFIEPTRLFHSNFGLDAEDWGLGTISIYLWGGGQVVLLGQTTLFELLGFVCSRIWIMA